MKKLVMGLRLRDYKKQLVSLLCKKVMNSYPNTAAESIKALHRHDVVEAKNKANRSTNNNQDCFAAGHRHRRIDRAHNRSSAFTAILDFKDDSKYKKGDALERPKEKRGKQEAIGEVEGRKGGREREERRGE